MSTTFSPMLSDEERHVRQLLGQRQMGDVLERMSAVSEYSDTPSVYSRAHYSPYPDHASDHGLTPLSSRQDRNRLNDLAVSMLELEDSSRPSSYADDDERDRLSDNDDDDEEDTTMSRMSLLGPKMRFHSKAPWEMEGETLQEEDELDAQSSRSSKLSPARSTFGKQVFGRSSAESQAKKSFESGSSRAPSLRGATQSNAQTNSSASLTYGTQEAPRKPFVALARIRSSSRSPGATPQLSSNNPRINHAPYSMNPSDHLPDHRLPRSTMDSGRHPYANPELGQKPPISPVSSASSVNFPGVYRSDSVSTVTDSQSNSFSTSRTFSSGQYQHSAPSSPRSAISGKDISSPMPVQSSPYRPSVSSSSSSPQAMGRPGWADQTTTPAFNLISLEEARAQRMRHVTAQSSGGRPVSNESRADDDAASSKSRTRSISAGSKAKLALSNIVTGTSSKPNRESESPQSHQPAHGYAGPGRTIKHKKSGLMRLFNGGRDDRSPPPPVPLLSDGYASYNTQQQSAQSPQRSQKDPGHRVPVPQLSSSLFDREPSPQSLATARPDHGQKRLPALSLTVPTSNNVLRRPSAGTTVLAQNPSTDCVPQSAPPNVSEFPALRLRPVSTAFSSQFGENFLSRESLVSPDAELDTPSSASPNALHSPITPSSYSKVEASEKGEDQAAVVRALQDQIVSTKKAWQRHIWELEGQVRDLKAELEELRAANVGPGRCEYCGHTTADVSRGPEPKSVVNRPRARTGTSGTNARFGCPD